MNDLVRRYRSRDYKSRCDTRNHCAPTHKVTPARLLYLRPEFQELPVARRAMRYVFPGGIPNRSRSGGKFLQNRRAEASLALRIRKPGQNRLLNYVLELFENLVGRIVRHQ